VRGSGKNLSPPTSNLKPARGYMIQNRTRQIFKIAALCLTAALLFAFFHYFSQFNRIVKERLSGRLWEMPARVYARPLELYPGKELDSGTLVQELEASLYLRVTRPADFDSPGKFLWDGNMFRIFCRPFKFEEGESEPRKIHVTLRSGKVDMLEQPDKGAFPELIHLDPVLIGSFYPTHREDRVIVRLRDVSPLLVKALLAVEDRQFYDHYGVNPVAILRAVITNIRKQHLSQGASTLTQQLAKNFFLTNEKTLKRKIDEMFMALALEWNYTKDQILEAYLNEVYMGQDGKRGIHGFGLAASFYFGKSLHNLQAEEIAVLVGLLKGPSLYDPRQNPDKAMKRRNTVLTTMAEQGLIRADAAKLAMEKPIELLKTSPSGESKFPAYMDIVKRQLLQEYKEEDLRSEGLQIFTAFDPLIQSAAEKAVVSQIKAIESGRRLPVGKLEAAVVVTSTEGNEILAAIGGRNPEFYGFNRAADAKRPIGSLIKPAVYLTALQHPEQYSLITLLDDSLLQLRDEKNRLWTPQNYDRQYHGKVPLYLSLAHSYNAATVRLGMALGLKQVFETLQEMGFSREISPYPSSLLGTIEMSPLEVAQMYQTLASGGFFSPARAIRSVYTADGKALQRYPLTVRQNFEPGPVYLLNKILQSVVIEGTAASVLNVLPKKLGAAGKTGTTDDLKDSWFAGFTGDHLAVVWVGRDDNKSCGLTGSSGALQIWGETMAAIRNKPLDLPQPESVEWVVIDPKTGFRTDEVCDNAMAIPYIIGTAPKAFISCPKAAAAEKSKKEDKPVLKPSAIIRWLKELF